MDSVDNSNTTYVSRDQLEEWTDTWEDIAESDESRIKYSIAKSQERKKAMKSNITIIMFVVGAVLINITININNVERLYPKAFHWYNMEAGALSTDKGEGNYVFTPFDAAVSANYPVYHKFRTFMFSASDIGKEGSIFLLAVLENFAIKWQLGEIHWNGSAQQLGLSKIDEWLPPPESLGRATGDIEYRDLYANYWNNAENPWKNMFSNYGEMQAVNCVRDYFDFPDKSILKDLFQGGLCYAADMQSRRGKSGMDMLQDLIGGAAFYTTDCKWSKIQKSVDMGTLVFTVAQIGLGATLPTGPATVAALGAGGAAGYYTHQNAKC